MPREEHYSRIVANISMCVFPVGELDHDTKLIEIKQKKDGNNSTTGGSNLLNRCKKDGTLKAQKAVITQNTKLVSIEISAIAMLTDGISSNASSQSRKKMPPIHAFNITTNDKS